MWTAFCIDPAETLTNITIVKSRCSLHFNYMVLQQYQRKYEVQLKACVRNYKIYSTYLKKKNAMAILL